MRNIYQFRSQSLALKQYPNWHRCPHCISTWNYWKFLPLLGNTAKCLLRIWLVLWALCEELPRILFRQHQTLSVFCMVIEEFFTINGLVLARARFKLCNFICAIAGRLNNNTPSVPFDFRDIILEIMVLTDSAHIEAQHLWSKKKTCSFLPILLWVDLLWTTHRNRETGQILII